MKKIYYIKDLADLLGSTESAVRNHAYRQSWPDAIPPPIRLGGRWAWRVEDVDTWLAGKAVAPKKYTAPARPVGRPRKTKTMEP